MSEAPLPPPALGEPSPDQDALVRRLVTRFPRVDTEVRHGELTVHVDAAALIDLLNFCHDDPEIDAELLADLSGVHWPAGDHVVDRQISTTGWPDYRTARDVGVIEVLYVLRSLERNHWFRVVTSTSDEDPRLPSVTGIYPTADFHEREVYDFFGVWFEGHPRLTRIHMPDDWIGHPHRKDYPLGGVTIDYANEKFIPSPSERSLREVVK